MRVLPRPIYSLPATNGVEFGAITQRHDRILIVATGPSMSGIKINRIPGVAIIAVKQAIRSLGDVADYWFTVDPNLISQYFMSNPIPGVQYIAAVPDDYGTRRAKRSVHRVRALDHVLYLRRITGTGVLSSKEKLSEDPRMIHTGNSAWGALGAAYLMRPKKIGMLGIDGTQENHGIGVGAPRGTLEHLPSLFATAVLQLHKAGIEVLNGSPSSRLVGYSKCSPETLLSWI